MVWPGRGASGASPLPRPMAGRKIEPFSLIAPYTVRRPLHFHALADRLGGAVQTHAQHEQRYVVALLAALEGLERVVDARGDLVGVERAGRVEQLGQPIVAIELAVLAPRVGHA